MISIRRLTLAAGLGVAALAVAGCGSAGSPGWTFAPNAAPPAPAAAVRPGAAAVEAAPRPLVARTVNATAATAATAPVVHEYVTIVTGDMIGKTEYPAYVPSNLVLPANSTVVISVTNFDDATALPKGSEKYARAAGIEGAITVEPIDLTNPNGAKGRPSAVTSLPVDAVSHTFTIDALGINVPIAAHARVTFTIHTGAAGTYTFRCYDPCGDGAAGWGTAMATKNYMEGTITVV